MPTFQITGPDGKKYRVTGDNADGALAALQEQLGDTQAAAPATIDPKTMQPPGVPAFVPPGVEGYDPKTGNVAPQVSQGDAYGLGAADIGGMGFADELAAPIGALISGDPREKVLQEMRAQSAGAQEQHPKSFLTGQIGGGVAQAVAGGVPQLLRGGGTLLGKMLAGSLMGGTSGAIHGAGSGTDAKSRIINALIEGGVGTAAGAALPAIGVGASNLYAAGRDALVRRGMPAPMEIMRLLAQAVPDLSAARSNIAAAGPDAMVADAGPNARAILDTSIQRGGAGGQAARGMIEDRATRAGADVNSALDSAMGQPQGIKATQTAIREGSAGARHAAYDGPNGAYSKSIDYSHPKAMEIENIVKTRVPKSAIDEANALMRAEGVKSKQINAIIDDAGDVTFEVQPDVRQLDYITRGLNEVADQADAQGKLGGTTAKGRAYGNLSKEIRSKLKDLVPEYGVALDTAADPIRRSKAVKFGSTALSPSTTRDEVAEFVDGITKPERAAALQGIRSHIDDTIANVTRTVQDPNTDAREAVKALKDLSSRASREKITAIVDDPKVADELFKKLDEAASAFDLRAATTENSKTYARQTVDRRVREMTQPGPVGQALEGKPLNAVKSIVQMLTGRTPERLAGKEDALYKQLSEVLTSRATPEMLGSIEQVGKRDVGTKLIQDRIIQALMGGVRPGSALAGSTGQRQLGPRR